MIYMMPIMRLAIVGHRGFFDRLLGFSFIYIMIKEWGRPDEIVSGGAKGADHLAEEFAINENIPMRIYRADWDLFGDRAGPIRNQKIVDRATHMIAFLADNSTGTANSIEKAEAKGIPLQVVTI